MSIRGMFGRKGIYSDGRIIALVLRDALYLKSDATRTAAFEAAGGLPWTYAREGRAAVARPCHSLPDRALDDPDAMARYAALAVDAAARAGSKRAAGRSRAQTASNAKAGPHDGPASSMDRLETRSGRLQPCQAPVPISMKAGMSSPKPTGEGPSSLRER